MERHIFRFGLFQIHCVGGRQDAPLRESTRCQYFRIGLFPRVERFSQECPTRQSALLLRSDFARHFALLDPAELVGGEGVISSADQSIGAIGGPGSATSHLRPTLDRFVPVQRGRPRRVASNAGHMHPLRRCFAAYPNEAMALILSSRG